jgi:succinate dehydrogenase / fumarate reductase, cytochrome b subunit
MAQPERPLSPFLHYRWEYTNTLSILHRITGVVLTACFLVLVYWLAAAAAGPDAYGRALRALQSPLVQLVLVGGLFSFSYHLLNGIRHLFWDAGYGFELPVARRSGWVVAISSLVLSIGLWLLLRGATGGST